jgi:hypothetical protein
MNFFAEQEARTQAPADAIQGARDALILDHATSKRVIDENLPQLLDLMKQGVDMAKENQQLRAALNRFFYQARNATFAQQVKEEIAKRS